MDFARGTNEVSAANVTMAIAMSEKGRIAKCEIIESSGSTLLDRLTRNLITKRAQSSITVVLCLKL